MDSVTNIYFVCATKGKKEDTLLFKWLSKLDAVKCFGDNILYDRKYNILYRYIEHNTKSLAEVYNNWLDNNKELLDGWVIFLHDDVMINGIDIFERLKNLKSEEFDVIGLAGARSIRIRKPTLWHLMSERQDWRGSVAHYHPNSDKDYHVTSFGKLNERVLVIDGLFIGIKTTSLTEDIRFDSSNVGKWHLYDIDFCLTCNKHKKKIGVVDIPVIHKSPGLLSLEDENFLKSQDWFLNKWSNA